MLTSDEWEQEHLVIAKSCYRCSCCSQPRDVLIKSESKKWKEREEKIGQVLFVRNGFLFHRTKKCRFAFIST